MFIWRLTNVLEGGIEAYALETDLERLNIFQKALNIYKLRRPITIESLPKYRICFCSTASSIQVVIKTVNDKLQFQNIQPSSNNVINWTADPRVSNFGYRSLIEDREENFLENDKKGEKEYITHRYKWGIGEGMEIIDQIPLAMNGDLLNGISFEKGFLNFFYNY